MKLNYAASAAITITTNSLASTSARQGTAVDNTSNDYLDCLLGGSFKTATGSLGTNPVVNVWLFALTDGTNYSGGASGSDASYTMPTSTGNLVLFDVVPVNTAGTVEYMPPKSVASAFGGVVPPKWGVIVQNLTGLALDASAGGALSYVGVTTQ